MKKVSLLVVFLLGIVASGFAQTTTKPTDFFAGKWEMVVVGTPNGDAKLIADLVRKDGKLTGELADAKDPSKEKIKIDSIDETADKLSIAFQAQGNNITMDLTKVDDDNLKGSVMGMFDATAKRLK
jgi:23S rRNA maturation-related 3'-5' exoribonuclease YhaM